MPKLDKYKIKEKAWKLANKDRERENNRTWVRNNLEHRRAYKRALYKKQKQDINFVIKKNLRSRFSFGLKNNEKQNSVLKYLGCSIEEVKIYLQSKFQEGMTWDNYGIKGWHIDHIVPLERFDHTDESQIYEAWHYTNLQPLWWQDNLRKGIK